MPKINFKQFRKPASVLAICLSLVYPSSAHASIEGEMAKMFNSMELDTNYTKGGSFHGQSGSLYTGGNLSVRTPVSNVNLANVSPPSISAGCGGIDLFGGSFSFVSKEQFIQFTRNLGNNAAGVAFDLALKSLDPMIQDAIGGIRAIANQINQSNLSSCEAGKQLAGGLMGALGAGINNQCRASAVSSGAADDGSESRFMCQFGNNLVNEVDKMRGTGKPQDTLEFTGGNLGHLSVTRAFGGNVSAEDIDWMLSLTGTIVVTPPQSAGKEEITVDAKFFEPTIKSVKQLLNGNEGGDTGEHITLDILQCRDGAKKIKENCVIKKNVKVKSIRYMVKNVIKDVTEKIRTDSGWANNAQKTDMLKLINNTEVPILKLAISDAFLGTTTLQNNSIVDLIAIDFASTALTKYEREVRTALGFYNKTGTATEVFRERMYANLGELRQEINQSKQIAFRNVEVEKTFIDALSKFENQWRASFTQMSGALDFDQANRF